MSASRTFSFRTLNVFTTGSDDPFSGNPLCVFEDARGLSTEEMQALARQLNLSETTFVLPAGDDSATAQVRIFTPTYEMPFAGHPTLGTAHVVRDLLGTGDEVVLRVPAGDIPVRAVGDRWTLRAKAPAAQPVQATRERLAAMVGLPVEAIGAEPLLVNTGVTQLILPLRSVEDVRAASADPRLLRANASSLGDEALVYVWAPVDDEVVEARLFFTQGASAIEDPATGSACANLGGWFHLHGERRLRRVVHQGAQVGRPSVLDLEVDDEGQILVTGEVRQVGTGNFTL
ncbi:PhzF family phenazine biosynthesis protein [Oryzihumus leptocrescens]|uniref:PhzF family phenazine biosynthesis protein n=1 Tax=Oryzihumus leptocrescens TaxID=297536 RepID=A0A542ZJ16_9MICO|nr:PhzF family phenazine biosynthesis protein [Oryzihumus leptocrescens]TQL60343.1 PhzF family phenazine biosynthesis protein [Oryzihumus leptocrescens]